ncbi:polysaccharide biosynthesis/export family protein [Ferruginibacter albus]|uniref:polysaccharide biosynthesis/export family protein n=1 Tax=Ferruginibacter albus TaxID=2875540 RepID=UPI001CC6DDC8|nr:SLBB domain-containing protein [Ferruginibacter albus]UAY52254.1 SLBB domain-containing protein [Ferruginibacter albus]
MNFKRGIALIFFCFLFQLVASAQASLLSEDLSSVKVDDLSDKEIKTYYQKALSNGLSEQTVYTALAQRGMPASEIDKLKERIDALGQPKETDNVKNSDNEDDDDNEMQDSTAYIKSKYTSKDRNKKDRDANRDAYSTPMKKVKSDLSIFGSELFTESSLVFEPNLRIPTPAGYILGPDDELIVNVFGFSERTYNLTVNEEGNIYIPQVGPLYVTGLTIEQASAKIKAKLRATIYKAIGSGQTDVQISLGKIRSVRVTVIGEAKKPGTYTVSSLTTLFNLLYLCGGPSDYGSYRNIELIRGNDIKRKVDLYNFLLKGDQKDNVLLREGDVIRIPYYTTRVILNGNIKHKGKYEMQGNETFQDLLSFSGGFADDAYKAGVTVYQLTEKDRRINDLTKEQYAIYKPQSSDSIVVGKLLNRFENKLIIKGAIMRPGEYALSSGLTLKELIEKAGGVKEDVYSKRGSISRLNSDRTPYQLSFDIDSILNGSSNVVLKKDDSVTVYSIFDLRNEQTVSIDGLVKKPGTYKWAENITLRDVILTAGGLTEFGDPSNVEIARVIKNAQVTQNNYLQTEIINANIADSTTMDIILKPSDIIIVKQRSGYSRQRSVFVDGMVINPGRYVLKRSGDKVADLIKRVGGFTSNADSSTIVIRRYSDKNKSAEEREKTLTKLLNLNQDSLQANPRIKNEIYKNYDIISINLKEALENPSSSENMILEDGDIVTIDRNTNLVKVSGEVFFPTIIPFEKGRSVKYYIQKSGNVTPQGRKSSIMVIYPDGRASKVRHFLFFKNYPEVTSRSEIFVPQKSTANKTRISLGEWSLIVSALAIVANVIISTRK